ncbi:MAG: hypothetical protein ABI324_30690 [Ktedonobacteraceae bacterium]
MSLLARLLALSDRPHQLISPHPSIWKLQSHRVLMLFVTGFWLMVGLFAMLSALGITRRIPILYPFLLPLLLFPSIIVFDTVALRFLRRLDRLRFAAAHGEPWLLANSQPVPDIHALHLPMTIVLRPSRRLLLWAGLMLLLLFDIPLALLTWPDLSSHFSIALFWWRLIVTTVIMGGVIAFLLAVAWRARRVIEVTQEGIRSSSIKGFGMNMAASEWLFWPEARLFACYPAPGSRQGRPMIVYELSSASRNVRWTWVQRKKTLRDLEEPVIAFEEHRAQMQALSALVAAKTGLALYDLGQAEGMRLEDILSELNISSAGQMDQEHIEPHD